MTPLRAASDFELLPCAAALEVMMAFLVAFSNSLQSFLVPDGLKFSVI